MKIDFILPQIPIPKEGVLEILDDIYHWKIDNPDFEECKLAIISSSIINYLADNTHFEFRIEACNLELFSYKYLFNQWLELLPFVYIEINKRKDFYWNLIEQGYETSFTFDYLQSESLYLFQLYLVLSFLTLLLIACARWFRRVWNKRTCNRKN